MIRIKFVPDNTAVIEQGTTRIEIPAERLPEVIEGFTSALAESGFGSLGEVLLAEIPEDSDG